jgi:flagellar hook-length control protein FliK
MSLMIASPAAVTLAAPPANAPPPSEVDPGGPGSFGEALSRATKPDADATAKPDKAAASTPVRRPGASTSDADKPANADAPVNLLGLVPLEHRSRPAPPSGNIGERALAHGAAAAVQAAVQTAGITPLEQPAQMLPADALSARPDPALEAGAEPEPALALASLGARDRSPVAAVRRAPAAGDAAPAPDAAPASTRLMQPENLVAAAALPEGPLTAPPAQNHDIPDVRGARAETGAERLAGTPAATSLSPREASPLPSPDTARDGQGFAPATPPQPPPAPLSPVADASGFAGLPVTHATPQATSAAPEPATAAPVGSLSVDPQVGSSEWGRALSQQLAHLGRAGHETAELQLNPPGLGPLKVSLSMNDQQIQASFVSAHLSVRAAVEAALPQLRAALADSGISLGETSVSSDGRQQADVDHGQGERQGYRHDGTTGLRSRTTMIERSAIEPRQRSGGASVDIYA